jgi:hypothetical protein
MPNLGPLITSRADNNPLYSLAVENVTGLPYGISYNNNWVVAVGKPYLYTTITVPGLVNNTPLSCSIQMAGRTDQDITDASNCWLITAIAFQDVIYIYIYAGGTGTNGQPVGNARFGISWAIAGDPV